MGNNQRLEAVVTPFLALAKERYPNLPPSEALEKLQSEMHQLENRTSTLEQKTTPRSLNLVQTDILIKSLSPYQNQVHNILIVAPVGDTESFQFAEVFRDIFEKAGWNVHTIRLMEFRRHIPSGIIMEVGEPPYKDGDIIYDAFQAVGLEVQLQYNPELSINEVMLLIGTKKQ